MTVFPICKINLGLNVVAKRPDGYHDLETVFYPIPFTDALEVIRSDEFEFDTSGLPIGGNVSNNLCIKAYQLLKANFPQLPTVKIYLQKVIPMGAGLGGGSSDGAFMLLLLNEKLHLGLSQQQLINYALQLGSDCPFFIINKPSFATGRGENLSSISLNLSDYKILLVNPGIHVSTKDAFAGLTPQKPENNLQQIIHTPITSWKDELVNDFEQTIFPKYPDLHSIKLKLYEHGAVYASMTGTGSTVYGIFKRTDQPSLSFPPNYFERWCLL